MAKGTFERLAALWRAKVNAWLDQVEDPEKMINQTIRDMEVAVEQAVAATARAMADQRRLEKQRQLIGQEMESWQEKAERAMAQGDEEEARQALAQKVSRSRAAEELATSLEESRQTTAQLRAQLEELRRRWQEARNRQGSLIARYRWARLRLGEGVEGAGSEVEPFARFARLEQQIQGHEETWVRAEQQVEAAAAEAELRQELAEGAKADRQLQQLDRDRQLEEELTALRRKVKKEV